jgi:GDPmannose 4,6-dehydratase
MKALLFGVNGQDGYYLARLLQGEGLDVLGIGRGSAVNLSRYESVKKIVEETKPDFIFHLAANSTTSHDAMFDNEATIAQGSINILEAVKNHSPKSKTFISGSGLQFKNSGKPIRESDNFEANSAYAVSRIHSVFAARYFRTFGLKVYVGYFFNHDSPRRSERHMTKRISEAAKRIAAGSNEVLEIGNISTVKEYGYAEDIVRGLWSLVRQVSIFEANIGTGKGYSIENWLDICFTSVNKNWHDFVALKPGFKSEYDRLVCDPSLMTAIGWEHQTSIEQLARIMMS